MRIMLHPKKNTFLSFNTKIIRIRYKKIDKEKCVLISFAFFFGYKVWQF
jgi:hypothetical protein